MANSDARLHRFVRSGSALVGSLIAAFFLIAFLVAMPRSCRERAAGAGALRTGGPYLQIVGHTYRDLDGTVDVEELAIGSGPEADLRLTESGIPPHLARLEHQGATLGYLHDTTTRKALFNHIDDSILAHVDDSPGPATLRVLAATNRVVWADDRLTAEALEGACMDDVLPSDAHAVDLRLVDAVGFWVDDRSGQPRTLELPMLAGAMRPMGEGAMYFDGDHLWLASATAVAGGLRDCQGLSGEAAPAVAGQSVPQAPMTLCLETNSTLVRTDGVLVSRWLDRVQDWLLEGGLDRATAFRTLSPEFVEELEIERLFATRVDTEGMDPPNTLFIKPSAYFVVDEQPALPVGVTGSLLNHDGDPDSWNAATAHPFRIMRRNAQAESTAPRLRRLTKATAKSSQLPLIGRREGAMEHVYLCSARPDALGEAELGQGDILIAGTSNYYRVSGDPTGTSDALRLSLTVPPRDRVAALASLSTGRLRAQNPRRSVPSCTAEGSNALLLRGSTSASVFPDAPPPSHWSVIRDRQSTYNIPLPAWAARHSVQAGQGRTTVKLAEVCQAPDGTLQVTPHDSDLLQLHPDTPRADGAASLHDGDTMEVGGHLIRYRSSLPFIEQAVPLTCFLALVAGYTVLGVRRLRQHWDKHKAALRKSPPGSLELLLVLVATMVAVGAMVQVRMAAGASLLAATDYLQRHLLTGAVAMAGMYAVLDLSLDRWTIPEGARPDRKLLRTLPPRLLRHSATFVAALFCWLLLDAGIWWAMGPDASSTLQNEAVVRSVVSMILATGLAAPALAYLSRSWNPARHLGAFAVLAVLATVADGFFWAAFYGEPMGLALLSTSAARGSCFALLLAAATTGLHAGVVTRLAPLRGGRFRRVGAFALFGFGWVVVDVAASVAVFDAGLGSGLLAWACVRAAIPALVMTRLTAPAVDASEPRWRPVLDRIVAHARALAVHRLIAHAITWARVVFSLRWGPVVAAMLAVLVVVGWLVGWAVAILITAGIVAVISLVHWLRARANKDTVTELLVERGPISAIFAAAVGLVVGVCCVLTMGPVLGAVVGLVVGAAAGAWSWRSAHDVLNAAVTVRQPGEARPLFWGVMLLAVGALIGSSGRGYGGFGLKPAEYAPLLVGLGLAGLLVAVGERKIGKRIDLAAAKRRAKAPSGGDVMVYGIYLRTGLWLLGISGVVGVLYAIVGDFGPLLVLVPAMALTVAMWVFPWRPRRLRSTAEAEDDKPRRENRRVRIFGRLAVCLGTSLAILALASSAHELLVAIQENLTEIPIIGGDIARAADRFQTHTMPWYTHQGEWVTQTHWIVAEAYQHKERFVSNLHSDLIFLAVQQSFGLLRALMLMLLLTGLTLSVVGVAESTLSRAYHHLHLAQERRKDNERLPPEQAMPSKELRRARSLARQGAVAGFFAYFVAAYLLAEIEVHISTCYHTSLQTGITLPWVSSGGSASTSFALLIGMVVGVTYEVRTRIGHHNRQLRVGRS